MADTDDDGLICPKDFEIRVTELPILRQFVEIPNLAFSAIA